MSTHTDGPTPVCCGREMTIIRSGRYAGFAIWIWRCTVCERFTSTNRRYDGHNYWVGAMGEAVLAEINDLIANAYAPDDPAS